MSGKNKKQFGVWMDSHHATITGRENLVDGDFVILGQVSNAGSDRNSNENASNNQEITKTHQFFKAIADKMTNLDEVHVTGTGQIQAQFIQFLADTPQYKNAEASESTSNKMSDDKLVEFITSHYN